MTAPPIPTRPYFPGMRQPEALIWAAWLSTNHQDGADYSYNVPIGPSVDPGAGHPDGVRTGAIYNSQRKVDVIIQQGVMTTIVEVKERAQLGAIGQLLGYRHLWDDAHPGELGAKMLLLTARESAGVRAVSARHGIDFELVPVDLSVLPTQV